MIGWSSEVKSLQDRLTALETVTKRSEDTLASLVQEWRSERVSLGDLYDKVYKMLARWRQHERRDEEEEAQVVTPQEVTSERDAITEKILARRNKRGVSA